MKEIKIVFKQANHNDIYNTWFDIFIDGKKQEEVKRFSIDLHDAEDIDLCKSFSYVLEKYVNIADVAEQ